MYNLLIKNLFHYLWIFILECPNLFWDSLVNAFKFRGRANRREYISFYLVSSIIDIVLDLPIFMDMPHVNTVIILFYMVIFIPNISVTVRRLHDFNISGWVYFFYIVSIMIIISIFLIQDHVVKDSEIMYFLGSLYIVGFFTMIIRGTDGTNRYGDKAFTLTDNKSMYTSAPAQKALTHELYVVGESDVSSE